jgi:energy-coupling factor transporter ATP-binding protein EcfA2
MVEISISDFQGISCQFEIGRPLTLVAGPNGAGKSRIARALAAIVSDTTMPITGKRQDLREVLPGGQGRASVVLRDGDSLKAMTWEDGRCEPSARGDTSSLPRASRYAAGLVSLLSLSGKDKAAAFADTFKTQPTKAELLAACKAAELPGDDRLEALWQAIDVNGWDAVATDAANQARKLKGAWGEVTGSTWGSNAAMMWEPNVKQFADPAELQAALRRAEDALEDAKSIVAAREAERAMLPQRVDEVGGTTCPWCEKRVKFRFGRLERVEQEDRNSSELMQVRQAIAGADGMLANARDQVHHHERAVGAAQARIDDAAQARDKAKARADELHRQITEQLEIAKICGPAGLRQKKLEEVLLLVNRHLAELSQQTGVPILQINPDLEATLAGTTYHRLSGAWSWMARAIMQLEVARSDGSTVIVLDELSALESPNDRNRILSAICSSGITGVVFQAAWNPLDAARTPDLAASGYGAAYWLKPIVYDDIIAPETGEVIGQWIKESRLMPVAEVRTGANREAA